VGWNVKDLNPCALRIKLLVLKVCSTSKYVLKVLLLKSLLYKFCYIADAEKIVGWAISRHLMQNAETDPDAKLVLSCER